MKKLKLALLSTAMLVGMNQVVNAAYTQQNLDTLRVLTEARNTAALIEYLKANPGLLQGDDPLAQALREFVDGRSGVMRRIFGPRVPDLARVPDLPEGVVTSAQLDFGATGPQGS